MMKRLVMLLAVVSASVFAVSCEGLIDGFRDLIEDEMNEDEMNDDEMNDDESDGDDPMLEQGGTDLQYEAYDSYVELIKCSTSVIGEMTDERVITVWELAGITSETFFHYDGHGRPQSVSHYCIPHRLGQDRIETDYEFIYEPGNVSMVSRRKDYTEDGSLGYAYPDKIVNCVCSSEGIIEDMELSDGRKIRFYHDDDGYLNAAEVSAGTDVTSYSFLYDGVGRLAYIDPAPQFPESMNYVDNHHNANVDLNMFLLAHGIYDFNYDSSLLMILRMGGYLGYGLINKCFIDSGSIGGVYYMSYPEEKAGQTIHESFDFIKYDEDRTGCDVVYGVYGLNDINTDHISRMEISMPVTLYKLEYDAVVSDELFDPAYPDAGYAVDRRENEKEIRIDDYTVIITYEFEYYSKEEVVTR